MLSNILLDNQFLFYEKKYQEVYKETLNNIKEEYKAKDWKIFNSQWRKDQNYIPHGVRKRTIITIFGKLIYIRHRYRYFDKDKYKFVYLADKVLGIEKYQRINNHLRIKILNQLARVSVIKIFWIVFQILIWNINLLLILLKS